MLEVELSWVSLGITEKLFKPLFQVFLSLLWIELNIEIGWKREWFVRERRFPRGYWDSHENCTHFVESISSSHSWKRITKEVLYQNGGWVWTSIQFSQFSGSSKEIWRFYKFDIENDLSDEKLGWNFIYTTSIQPICKHYWFKCNEIAFGGISSASFLYRYSVKKLQKVS